MYLGLRVLSMAVHSWGVGASLELAKALGTCIYVIDKKHRDRATANLRRSFPDLNEKQLRRMAHESMQHMCMLGVEFLFTPRLVRIDTWSRYVSVANFAETMRLMLKKNQSLIMVTAHYGSWEILGYTMATLGFPTSSVARPLDNPYINEFVFGLRKRNGQMLIDKKGATGEVTDLLDRHGIVSFIADQNAGSKGMFVDFFGRKASTYKSIALLAMHYEVPVIIGYVRRRKEPFRFQCAAQDIIYPADWKEERDPLRYITQRYTKAIEDMVREDPAQYLWVHRRWKSRPKGEEPEAYD